MTPFDWRNPDYVSVFKQRAERLAKLRDDPALLTSVKHYYRTHIADFVNDWGVTVDPRVASRGRSPVMPMILWPKQREYLDWLFARWLANDPGIVVKSRDVGISWLAMGFSATLCIFYHDVSIGFGSEKEDKVDRSGDPDCLFYKGRLFLQYLPVEFRGGWELSKFTSAHMRLSFPDTAASITGEAGDNIGRGGRKSIYFVDESAHVPNPKAIDASLSANTDCRIDMSSVNGMSNSFAERAHNPSIPRFDFHFSDDPRKDAEWERKKRAAVDAVIFEAEYNCNFSASVDGVVIPSAHVMAAVDLHKKLGLKPSGPRRGAMDVADLGADANAFAVVRDFVIEHVESWKGSIDFDIGHSTERVFMLTDLHDIEEFHYDADGMGADVRSHVRRLNDQRTTKRTAHMFRGSGEVFDPDRIVEGTERTALDFFENLKAQAWWLMRRRFEYTYNIAKEFEQTGVVPENIDLSVLICISSEFAESTRLRTELSQPIWQTSKRGKVMVDKCPTGTKTEVRNAIKSPNLADAVMMCFAPRRVPMAVHPSLLNPIGALYVSHRR